MNELSHLRDLPETKAEVESFSNNLINSIQWGEVDPLELDGRLKALEEMIKKVRSSEEMTENILTEAEKYGQKTFDAGKYKHQIKEVGVKYDFSDCGDSEYQDILDSLKFMQDKKKAREIFLKAIEEDQEVFGSDGVQLLPPVKKSTTKVITLLK